MKRQFDYLFAGAPSVFGFDNRTPRCRVYFSPDSFLQTGLRPSRVVVWLSLLQRVAVLGHGTRTSIFDHNMHLSDSRLTVAWRSLRWAPGKALSHSRNNRPGRGRLALLLGSTRFPQRTRSSFSLGGAPRAAGQPPVCSTRGVDRSSVPWAPSILGIGSHCICLGCLFRPELVERSGDSLSLWRRLPVRVEVTVGGGGPAAHGAVDRRERERERGLKCVLRHRSCCLAPVRYFLFRPLRFLATCLRELNPRLRNVGRRLCDGVAVTGWRTKG